MEPGYFQLEFPVRQVASVLEIYFSVFSFQYGCELPYWKFELEIYSTWIFAGRVSVLDLLAFCKICIFVAHACHDIWHVPDFFFRTDADHSWKYTFPECVFARASVLEIYFCSKLEISRYCIFFPVQTRAGGKNHPNSGKMGFRTVYRKNIQYGPIVLDIFLQVQYGCATFILEIYRPSTRMRTA